jgi:hypothetical protein
LQREIGKLHKELMIPKHTMTAGDVARVVVMTVPGVHLHDEDLQPIRLANGHRRYDPKLVERFVRARQRVRAAR